MKTLGFSMGLSVAAGALSALVVSFLPLDAGTRTSAFLGVGVGTAIGLLALVIKTQLATLAPTGTASVKAVLTGQVLTFFLRLVAIGTGAIALHNDEALSPVAFVLAFFSVYLGQQFVEVRSLLAARAAKTEVS